MKIKERYAARQLRARGYSVKEMAKKLGVARSSVSMWVRDIKLSPKAQKRLLTKIQLGQFIAARNKKERTRLIEEKFLREARSVFANLPSNKITKKFLCAAIYWCEGGKNVKHGVNFINSDPNLIKCFLKFFRETFHIDDSRLRPQLHIHSYHNADTEIGFWSKITKIPRRQFTKPYIKPHNGRRIRESYKGCLSLRYYDTNLARQLLAYGKALLLGV